jgi:hypothetical protein
MLGTRLNGFAVAGARGSQAGAIEVLFEGRQIVPVASKKDDLDDTVACAYD